MRQKFLTWLFLLICAAFAVTSALSFSQFQEQARDRATQIMSTKLQDLLKLVAYTMDSMSHVMKINDASTLERARALAEIINLNPGILQSQEELQGICNSLGAAEIAVTNDRGIIQASVPASQVGEDLRNSEQFRPFLKCIDTPSFELCKRPLHNGAAKNLIQYAGVHRLDQPGIVRLGFRGQHEQMMRTESDFAELATHFELGENGFIVASHNGTFLNGDEFSFAITNTMAAPLNTLGEIDISGIKFYTYAVEQNGFRLVGLLPQSEMMGISLTALKEVAKSNIILFLIEFILVWILLQTLVLKGLGKINESLHRIVEGYKDERVNVKSVPEFTKLSTGINDIVDSLQFQTEREHKRLHQKLELAKSIRSTVLPNKFPAFPEYEEFDLYALCAQAQEMDGNFYDYFMPDAQHVCFLVGEVGDQGLPAALFMMRAISCIRSIVNSGHLESSCPRKINQVLCDGNIPGMALSLFLGILDIDTGLLKFFNAGEPGVLMKHGDEPWKDFPMESHPALGDRESSPYKIMKLQLHPGDRFLLYTTSIITTVNANHATFGDKRLKEALNKPMPQISDVPRAVKMALRTHTNGIAPRKGISMLAIEYKGKRCNNASIDFTAGCPQEAKKLIDEQLESVFAAPLAIRDIQQAAQAIFHALPADRQIKFTISCNEKEAELTLNYPGEPLNPLGTLPALPIDRIEYASNSSTGNTIKIWKTIE